MTSWPDFALGFSAGIFTTLATLLVYALCSVSPAEPEPDLSWMGEAERRMDDTAI